MKDFDISKIFGSKCRAKILERFFLEHSSGRGNFFHMRGIARDIDEQINSVKRELDSLTELGILKSKTELKKKYFYINPNFELIEDFTNIFLKIYNPIERLKNFFKDKDGIDLVLVKPSIFNKFIIPIEKQKKTLDIFIIGDFDRDELRFFLDDIYYGRYIGFTAISLENFFERLEYKDKMVKDILMEKGNIFIKDTMKVKEKLEKKD